MLRTLGFKYKVLRGNAEFAQLLAMPDASPPNIRMNDTGAIKVSFSGTFLPLPDGVDLLSDEIAPVLIVDGVEHQLGVFMPATVSESEDAAAASVSIEAYDRSWRLSTARTEALQYFAAGTNYLDAVKLLLTDAGVTTVIETPTAATLAEARQDWDVGTSYLEIVNQLLSEINYKEIWFNASGAAVLEPVVTPTAARIRTNPRRLRPRPRTTTRTRRCRSRAAGAGSSPSSTWTTSPARRSWRPMSRAGATAP